MSTAICFLHVVKYYNHILFCRDVGNKEEEKIRKWDKYRGNFSPGKLFIKEFLLKDWSSEQEAQFLLLFQLQHLNIIRQNQSDPSLPYPSSYSYLTYIKFFLIY